MTRSEASGAAARRGFCRCRVRRLRPRRVEAGVREAAPEVVVHQLTALPEDYDIRKID